MTASWIEKQKTKAYARIYAMSPYAQHTFQPDPELNPRREALWKKLPKNPFIPPSPEVQVELDQFLKDAALKP